jgi:hypothetical protein
MPFGRNFVSMPEVTSGHYKLLQQAQAELDRLAPKILERSPSFV